MRKGLILVTRASRSMSRLRGGIAVIVSLTLCLTLVPFAVPDVARAADPAWTVTHLTDGFEEGIGYQGDFDTSADRVVWSAIGQWMYPPEAHSLWDGEIYSWTADGGVARITQDGAEDDWAVVSGDRIAWHHLPHKDTYDNPYDNCAIMTWTPTGGAVTVRTLRYGNQDTWYSRKVKPQIAGDRIAWCEWSDTNGYQLFTWTPAGGVVQITTAAVDLHPEFNVRVTPNRVFWAARGGSDSGSDFELFTWSPSGGTVQLTQDDVGVGFDASGERVAYIASDAAYGGFLADIWTWTPTGGSVRIAESQRVEGTGSLAVSDSRVVWQVSPASGPYELWSWTPSLSARQIVGSEYSPGIPAVSGDRVAFVGQVPGSPVSDDYEVHTWTPAKGVERVSDNAYDESDPKVAGDRIVWESQGPFGEGGSWCFGLFMASPYVPDTTPPTTLMTVSHEPNPATGWILNDALRITLERRLLERGTTYYSYTSGGAGTVYSAPFTPLEGDRTLYYWSVDEAGNVESRKTWRYKFDSIAPTKPTGLMASSVGTTSLTLSWGPSTDAGSGVESYGVYIDGPWALSATAPATSVQVVGLQPGTRYEFSLTAMDVAGNMSGWTEKLAVTTASTPVGTAPTAIDDAYATEADTGISIPAGLGVLANDTDPGGLALTAHRTGGTGPANGTVTLSPDGSFLYTPNGGYSGVDTFTYRAYNGTAYSGWATVRMTVGTPTANRAPVLGAIGDWMASANTLLQFRATAYDPDSDPLTFSLVSAPLGASISADGLFQWTPTSAQSPGTYPVTVRVSDGRGGTDTESFQIMVDEDAGGVNVVPLEGTGRVETAVEVSQHGFTRSDYVIIATARAFPDALGGSALAGALDAPILLTEPTALPAIVRSEIVRLQASHVIVLGGTGAVSAGVYGQIDAIPGVSVERVFGATRYETAETVAARTIAELGAEWDGTAFIATGELFPDALGASPIAAAKGWPIYLAHPGRGDNAALIDTMDRQGVTTALVLGGSGAVTLAVQARANLVIGSSIRLAGDDRYKTAVIVARYGAGPAGLSWSQVAIATGRDFPDALAGGALQGKSSSVMLLVPSTTPLPADVTAVLRESRSSVTEVRFFGGTGAIPQTVRTSVLAALQ